MGVRRGLVSGPQEDTRQFQHRRVGVRYTVHLLAHLRQSLATEGHDGIVKKAGGRRPTSARPASPFRRSTSPGSSANPVLER
jgi:hypothetical protein